jgi:hypothetical protein
LASGVKGRDSTPVTITPDRLPYRPFTTTTTTIIAANIKYKAADNPVNAYISISIHLLHTSINMPSAKQHDEFEKNQFLGKEMKYFSQAGFDLDRIHIKVSRVTYSD